MTDTAVVAVADFVVVDLALLVNQVHETGKDSSKIVYYYSENWALNFDYESILLVRLLCRYRHVE